MSAAFITHSYISIACRRTRPQHSLHLYKSLIKLLKFLLLAHEMSIERIQCILSCTSFIFCFCESLERLCLHILTGNYNLYLWCIYRENQAMKIPPKNVLWLLERKFLWNVVYTANFLRYVRFFFSGSCIPLQ